MKISYSFKAYLLLILFLNSFSSSLGQVRVRIFAGQKPEYVVFSVTKGQYEMILPDSERINLGESRSLIVSKMEERLAVKLRNMPGFYADSVSFRSISEGSSFSISINSADQGIRSYSGDLKLNPDLGTIVMINTCKTEDYISGVVQAEGGNGKYDDYFKTQAVIARTYMFKNMSRHELDGFDLCDETHCQVYAGTATNSLIAEATESTLGLVILDNKNMLINPAFHSNCGGETSPAEFVWLAPATYLRSVKDPYCHGRANSRWHTTVTAQQWINVIRDIDHESRAMDIHSAPFNRSARTEMYTAGKINVPFREIREALALRSAFFSVSVEGNRVILRGKGYGHGVGLCQEGAIAMAGKGFDFRKIIYFYYSGVKIDDISKAVAPEEVLQ